MLVQFQNCSFCAEHTNFTCGQMKSYNSMGRREPPGVKYSTSSIYRNSYQSPQMHTEYDSCTPTTRFGSSPAYFPAKGIGKSLIQSCLFFYVITIHHVYDTHTCTCTRVTITVPTAMSSRIPKLASSPSMTKKVDKRITLHPPRGKKVASLV